MPDRGTHASEHQLGGDDEQGAGGKAVMFHRNSREKWQSLDVRSRIPFLHGEYAAFWAVLGGWGLQFRQLLV